MKTRFSIFLLFASVFVIGCSNYEETTDDLQSQIETLKATIQTLQGTIDGLQTSVGNANTANQALTGQLTEAQNSLDAAQALISSTQSGLVSATSEIELLTDRLSFLQEALAGVSYNQAVNLEATGTLSEQSAQQARQTVYGRWNIGGNAQKGFASFRNGCSFDFIEFLDESYLLAITLPDGEPGVLFGNYILNENSEGNVTSVDLMFDIGDNEIRVAQLTNVVVTENGGDLNATFDVVFTLPEDVETCNTLSGNVSAPKEEPVEEAMTANAISNHAKLVGEWYLKDFRSSEGGTIESILNANCQEYNEETGEQTTSADCEGASRLVVNFSDFGTYSITALAANGQPIDVEIGGWGWADDQDTFVVLGDSDEDADEYDVDQLDEREFIISGDFVEVDYILGGEIQMSYTGVFDGTVVDEGIYLFPSNAQPWAGFANTASEAYPLSFPHGGQIKFMGAARDADVLVNFRFEANPYPNTEPSFETASVNVSGDTEMEYVVEIPPMGDDTYNSALLYLQTRDAAVSLSGITIQAYDTSERTVRESYTFGKN